MRPLIAGNWKMHGMAPQLAEIAAIAASVKTALPCADILICLPATLIARAVPPPALSDTLSLRNSSRGSDDFAAKAGDVP